MLSVAVYQACKKLMRSGLANRRTFVGCTEEEEIAGIDEQLGITLPTSYRDFLKVMGRDADGFLVGSDYRYPTILTFREWAEKELREFVPGYVLPPSAFVFFSHQGYNLLWFDCLAAADPPVVLFSEMEKEPRIVAESFSAWLLMAVEDDIAACRELGELGGT